MTERTITRGMVTVTGRAHPLADTVYAEAPAGQTIAELLGQGASQSLRVELGGELVPRKLWPLVKPKAGQQLIVTAVPMGGGNNNKLLKIVVVIVAIVYAYYTGDFGGALKILAYGFAIVNLLVPPPMPKLPGAGDPFDTLNSLTGTQNRATVYSPIPCVIGTVRFFPTHAALPYTEIVGNDQYLRMLLDLGPGDLAVSDIKIGETPIEDYQAVQWEVTKTPTLYTNDIYELPVAVNLNGSGATASRTGQSNSTEMSLDLQCPSGLFGVDNKGRDVAGHINMTIEYRAVGAPTWLNAAAASGLSMSYGGITSDGTNFTLSSAVRKTVRVGVRWTLPASGQYEVRVTRAGTTWDGTTSATYGDMTWTVLRSMSSALPSSTGTTKLALRIRATDQLNSVVSTISVLASQLIRTYDPDTATWTTGVATSNNAWVYHWLLTAAPPQLVARLVPESRVAIDEIVDWAADCEAMGYVYNAMEESGRTQLELLRDVLASGRATFGMPNGKYGCVRDVAQTTPVQMFTPRNSWDFSGQRVFFDPPHALRCQFINPQANNQQDELIVYAEGYSADGAGGTVKATRYEVMDLRMCTDPVAVWRIGTYHLKASEQRVNTYTFTTDMEHLVCQRGQLVTAAHDVVEWGVASARIKSVSTDGLRIVLDERLELDPSKSYMLHVRNSNNMQPSSSVNATVTWDSIVIRFDMDADLDTTGLPTSVLELPAPIDVAAGDLCVVGEATNDIKRLIVQRIEPQQDLSARITAVDEAPDVPVAGTGTAPPFVSAITGTPWCSAPPPPDVTIRISDSGPDDAGVIHAVTGVSGTPKPGIHRLAVYNRQGFIEIAA